MIAKKPAGDLDPAMRVALKNHIMRKRQQLKQELEQDAIEKRLRREQEAKRKQDAMTLDQLKEQLSQLEKNLDNLRNEKHSLFAQLKQNMRVLNEDDTRRKQKEGEMNAVRQQHQQNEQNQQQIQSSSSTSSTPSTNQTSAHTSSQPATTNGSMPPTTFANQENHAPTPRDQKKRSTPNTIDPNSSHHSHILHPQQQQQLQQHHQLLQQQQNQHSQHHQHHHNLPQQQQIQPQHHQHQPAQSHQSQQKQPQQPLSTQANQNDHETPPMASNSMPSSLSGPSHLQRQPPLFDPATISHILNAHNFPRQPFPTHLQPPSTRPSNPYGPMGSFPPLGPPSLISGHGIPTSLAQGPHNNQLIRPSPPPMGGNHTNQMGPGQPRFHNNLSMTGGGGGGGLDFNAANLSTSTAQQLQQQQAALNSSAAAAAAALGIPYPSAYFGSNSPLGPSMTPQQALEHHHAALNAAAAAVHNHMVNNNAGGGGGGPGAAGSSNNSGNMNNPSNSNNSSRNNLLQSMKRPISAANLSNDTISPNKKLHSSQQQQLPPPPSQQNQQQQQQLHQQQQQQQQQQQAQNQAHQLSASLAANPYLSYPGLPPGFGGNPGAGGASLSAASLFAGQNLMRTPPGPPNINSILNSAAFSHLLSAHNLQRHGSPYLTNLPNSNRSSNPYGPMSPFPPLGGHHLPPSLISGHGIPTSLAHAPHSHSNPMIRPSPPPMSNNGNPLGSAGGGPGQGRGLPHNLPITSSGAIDFNVANLSTSTAQQLQQQQAALSALGIPYGPAYFGSNSPLGGGSGLTQQAIEQHHAALNAAAAAAHNHL